MTSQKLGICRVLPLSTDFAHEVAHAGHQLTADNNANGFQKGLLKPSRGYSVLAVTGLMASKLLGPPLRPDV